MTASAASPPVAAVTDLGSAAENGASGEHKYRIVPQEREQKKAMSGLGLLMASLFCFPPQWEAGKSHKTCPIRQAHHQQTSTCCMFEKV